MTLKTKILIPTLIILVVGILMGGVYIYSKYQRGLEILGTEDYEELIGGGLFRNKGVAIIEKFEGETNYAFKVYIEGVDTPPVLIKDSPDPLYKYLGKFVILTYKKERIPVLDHYTVVKCEVGPCPPRPVYANATLAVIKDVKEVVLSDKQRMQIEQ